MCATLLWAWSAPADVPERLRCTVDDAQYLAVDARQRSQPDKRVVGAGFQVELPEGLVSGGPFRAIADVRALRQDSNYFDKYSVAVEMGESSGVMVLLLRHLPSTWTFSVTFGEWRYLGRCEGGPA